MFCSPREAKKTCELMDYWPSFSVSNLDIGLKENLSWYTVLSLMSKILGWNLSLVIAFSIDKSEIYYIELSLIFKDETASLKSCLMLPQLHYRIVKIYCLQPVLYYSVTSFIKEKRFYSCPKMIYFPTQKGI